MGVGHAVAGVFGVVCKHRPRRGRGVRIIGQPVADIGCDLLLLLLLTAEERPTLRRQAASMMEVLSSLSDKIQEVKEI